MGIVAATIWGIGTSAPGAEAVSSTPVGTNIQKPSVQSKPGSVLPKFETGELSDADLREFLKAKLAQAEKYRPQSKQEIEEYRQAIAELNDRIAKGPSVSLIFERNLEKYLVFARKEGLKPASSKQPKWVFELKALLDALRERTPDGHYFCDTDFTLSQAHSALIIGGVRIGDLLPFAKKEISHTPMATEFHERYLRGLIACATDMDKDTTTDWLRYFELHKMEWERKNFQSDSENLKKTLKQK